MRIKRIKEKADIFTSAFSNNTQSSERILDLQQCHLDKDDAKNSVCRNMHPVLFLYNFINHLTG